LITTIPHRSQDYPTVGNWSVKQPYKLGMIEVSRMDDWRYCMLVALHELVELVLCLNDGIKEEEVTKFDIAFEKKRKAGNTAEPGNVRKAPYYKQHQFATKLEKLFAKQLGVNWDKYDKVVNKL